MLGSLFGVGLAATPRAVLAPLRDLRFVTLTLVIGWIVCPIVAVLLLRLVPLETPYTVALLMLALTPAAPFAPAMMRIAQGDSAYAAAFMVLAAVATVALMPLAIPWLVDGVSVGPVALARPLVIFVVLPLALGLTAKQFNPNFAAAVQRPVGATTNIAGLALLVLIVILYGRGVLDAYGSYAIALQLVFAGTVTLLAHVLGAGLWPEQRSVVTLGMASRNLGVAMVSLMVIEPDPRAMVMVAAAVPVTLLVSVLAARWLARTAPARVIGNDDDAGGRPEVHRHTRPVGRRDSAAGRDLESRRTRRVQSGGPRAS